MAMINISPTRMELSRMKQRLAVAMKGHRLLKDKRDELMRRFLEMIRETRQLRVRVEQAILEANRGFAMAAALIGREAFVSALLLPQQRVGLDMDSKSVMGVDVPVFSIQQNSSSQTDAFSYGYAFTSGELDDAILALSGILPDLLKLAQQEKTARLLAAEIEKTRRRVNALEYVMIPDLRDTIRFITMKLDENERGSLTRLMKVKDMMVEKQVEARRQKDALAKNS